MKRPLLISGFMAAGKSEVGRSLAAREGARFVDLDAEIERRTGKTVPVLFEQEGERAFRILEARTLDDLLASASEGPLVVALGGGALLDRPRRVDILGRAVVVTLTASAQELARRAQQDGGKAQRPLLSDDDPLARIETLLAARQLAYAEAHAQVPTEGREVAVIAADVLRVWQREAVCVAAGLESYEVEIGSGLIESRLAEVLGACSGCLLVTDENVGPLHGDKARRALSGVSRRAEVVLVPGEEHKNLQGLGQIFDGAFGANLDRKAIFVGLGGGVVTDMTGFAAATWVRGVRWIGLPTTLLSQVDASVGGKTAVDFKTAKNSVGAFWQPSSVLCDIDTLETETDRMYVGALSEVVKTALIGDAQLFSLLEEHAASVVRRDPEIVREVVDRCVRVKARVVALDERETGLRATLNLGHTMGHALEASAGYTGLTHGEAVSLGLVAALRLGERKGHTPPDLTARVVALLTKLGLPKQLERARLEESTALIGHDKKRAGSAIRFVYAHGVGDVRTESIELTELEQWAPQLAD